MKLQVDRQEKEIMSNKLDTDEAHKFNTSYKVGQDNLKKWGMDAQPCFFYFSYYSGCVHYFNYFISSGCKT